MTHHTLIHELNKRTDVTIHMVSGGDINTVYRVSCPNEKTNIIKINDANAYSQMLSKEVNGLNELRKNKALNIPEVHAQGELGGLQYLILAHIPQGAIGQAFWGNFGQGLSKQHSITHSTFGFDADNYIGCLHQSNTPHQNWADFLINERLIPQVKLAVDEGIITLPESKQFERFYAEVNNLWPTEKPALLHGDLWSGNYIKGLHNQPYLIDPAVYYGHREMDLGMMHLFGGFDTHLFTIYDEMLMLERGWQGRIKYNQLYPLLVHLNLFGRTYFNQIRAIVKQF